MHWPVLSHKNNFNRCKVNEWKHENDAMYVCLNLLLSFSEDILFVNMILNKNGISLRIDHFENYRIN